MKHLIYILFTTFCALQLDVVVSKAELPTALRQQLQANAAVIGETTSVWNRIWSSQLGPAQRRELLGEERNYFFESPCVYDLALGGSRFRCQVKKPNGSGTTVVDSSFDSENWFNGTGELATLDRGETPYLSVRRLTEVAEASPNLRLFDTNFFDVAGYAIPNRAKNIGMPLQSEIVRLSMIHGVGCSVTQQILNAQKVTTISLSGPQTTDVYYVSPEFSMAVVKHEQKDSDNRLVFAVHCYNLEEVGDTGVFLPRRVEKGWHRWRSSDQHFNSPVITEVYELQQVAVARGKLDTFYQIDYDTPGSIVADARIAEQLGLDSKQLTYRVPADPEDLDEAIAVAANRAASRRFSRRTRWVLLIGVNVLALTITIGYFCFRSKK